MHIFLDIETIPGQLPFVRDYIASTIKPPATHKKPDTIKAWHDNEKACAIDESWRKTSFDGALGHIAVASVAIGDGEPMTFYADDILTDTHTAESRILIDLFSVIRAATEEMLVGGTKLHRKPVFVGHNIISFDLPFIFQRAAVLGIKPPSCIPFAARPWGDDVFDTMTRWHPDRERRASLDKLCQIFGIQYASQCDGSQVWDWIKNGRIADVAAYCAEDVRNTRAVYKRLTFQQDA